MPPPTPRPEVHAAPAAPLFSRRAAARLLLGTLAGGLAASHQESLLAQQPPPETSTNAGPKAVRAIDPLPEGLVVLTFDDSVASQATFVAPLLSRLGFGATFFITEGFEFGWDKENYMTWDQIKALHAAGFEIGNHTRAHKGVAGQDPENLVADIEYIEKKCVENGIPAPTSFCYPGYGSSPGAVQVLRRRGYRFARSGGARAYEPLKDDPLVLPQAFDGKPASTLEQFKAAVDSAKDGKIAILTFHGVPDIKHPWVSTEAAKFEAYMTHLKETGRRVVALRDLARYVAWERA